MASVLNQLKFEIKVIQQTVKHCIPKKKKKAKGPKDKREKIKAEVNTGLFVPAKVPGRITTPLGRTPSTRAKILNFPAATGLRLAKRKAVQHWLDSDRENNVVLESTIGLRTSKPRKAKPSGPQRLLTPSAALANYL